MLISYSHTMKGYRTSGHESFPFRYTWLPKAVQKTMEDNTLLANEDKAMVELGIGKNMVRSLKFWSQATNLIESPERGEFRPTALGEMLLGEDGLDPYLEDVKTLWLIHWQLSRHSESPLLAWDFLLNRWHEPELAPSKIIPFLTRELSNSGSENPSKVTIERHLEVFFRIYVPGRGKKGNILEDNLDCPLVELDLMEVVANRQSRTANDSRTELIYRFRKEEKSDVTPALFLFCLNDFWNQNHNHSNTLTLKEIAHGPGGPGQIFKIPEEDVRCRMETLTIDEKTGFTYKESASLPSLERQSPLDWRDLLNNIYVGSEVYA